VGQHIEIERRFFVTDRAVMPWRDAGDSSHIVQHYIDSTSLTLSENELIYQGNIKLCSVGEKEATLFRSNPSWSARIRFRDDQTTLTLKGKRTGASAVELEWGISRELGLQAVANEDCPSVEKRRYLWRGQDGMLWEVDEFLGGLTGLILAEVELSSEDESIEIPLWAALELTGNHAWANSSLAYKQSQIMQQ
jgi:adenylate cyclase